jgi:dTDP-4-dehydrorhamnose reductase
MERKEYNGWTNYETWCVNLWLDNEEGTQDMVREMAIDAYSNAEGIIGASGHLQTATNDLAECIKQFHEENTPKVTGVYADLLNTALSEVNWYEMAEYWMSAIEDERKEMVGAEHANERA